MECYESPSFFGMYVMAHCAKKPLSTMVTMVTTMPATSKTVLFPRHNYQLTTSTDDQQFDYCRIDSMGDN